MCLFLSLSVGCSQRAAVRTETITVKVPTYVALPDELVKPCAVSLPNQWTNGALADYVLRLQACLRQDADKLERIKRLQPIKGANVPTDD